ncbi:hypothetical protein LCER1_G001145 [Lachnellula cervina]|uniref:Uncharacterized protein n=1 Tax=Lachnellula cervina TaxID=1316786 RepID=A0A7D8UWU6_9HELO|nr:hypothetical protein LCER1_G001145 [Lachnellula cervina]
MASPTTITPNLLPITGTWAAPFALYGSILSSRIVAKRMKTEKFIGEKSVSLLACLLPPPPDFRQAKPNQSNKAINSLIPVQHQRRRPPPDRSPLPSNFLENVPLAFIFLALCELNGGNRKYLNYVMGAFLALRVAHVEGGLMLQGSFGTNGVGRPVGYFGSVGVVTGLATYAAYLAKGYWGF